MSEADAFADMVVMTIKSALSPVLERLAASEANVVSLNGTVADLRVRLTASEAKQAPAPVAVDLSVYERLAGAETTLKLFPDVQKAVGEVRDRQLALESRPSVVPDAEFKDQVKGLLLLPERIASIEATVAALPALQKSVTETRERQIAMEAKASVTPAPETDVRDHLVALSPVMERIAGLEAGVEGLTASVKRLDVNDRVVALETKAAQPTQEPDADTRERVHALSAVPERLASLEAQMPLVAEIRKDVAGVNDRLVVVETKQAAPVASVAPDPELRDGLLKVGLTAERLTHDFEKLEQRVSNIDTKHVEAVATVTKEVSVMRADVAVAAVRAFTPGPAGSAGRDGHDGVDGVSYDDLTATLENDRTIVLRAAKGERVKEIGSLKVPFMIFRGTWVEKDYEPGDVVNWSGSGWHCQAPTKAKPGESQDWKLFVKRGADGRDGTKDSATPVLPIVRTR